MHCLREFLTSRPVRWVVAKPPDGQSSWRHTSDTLVLTNADGSTWGSASVPLARDRLAMMFPLLGDPWSSFYAFEVVVRGPDHVEWTYHAVGHADHRPVRWTSATPSGELIPFPEIRARAQFRQPPDAPVIARVLAGAGVVEVHDARGRCRAIVRLVSVPGVLPETPVSGALVAGTTPLVRWAFPSGPDAVVRTVATSSP